MQLLTMYRMNVRPLHKIAHKLNMLNFCTGFTQVQHHAFVCVKHNPPFWALHNFVYDKK